MKKIPTLFLREFEDHRVVKVLPEVTPGLEWVLKGEGEPTVKIDGACCAIIDGIFYKRYDAKLNKNGMRKLPPIGSIPCDDPDPVTGHRPHWAKIDYNKPADNWFIQAKKHTEILDDNPKLPDGTYEAVGPHFNSNPYSLKNDMLIKHGVILIENLDRSFEGIRDYLKTHKIEGIVFWKDDEPMCKIKRSDFGFEWPIKNF
jgi:hypothetical protein